MRSLFLSLFLPFHRVMLPYFRRVLIGNLRNVNFPHWPTRHLQVHLPPDHTHTTRLAEYEMPLLSGSVIVIVTAQTEPNAPIVRNAVSNEPYEEVNPTEQLG